MAIVRPTGGGQGGGGSAAAGTVHADSPPTGSPIAANGTTNDATTLQALLTYVKNTFGAGKVVLPPGKTVKCNAGLTIPAGVQLDGCGSTLNFSALTSGAAVTVNDSYAAPLVDVRLLGPTTHTGGRVLTGPNVTGLDVTGFNLAFHNLTVAKFWRGIDVANENTYILDFVGGYMVECGTCVYADLAAAGVGNAGERVAFERYTFSASALVYRATAGGLGLWFKTCSMDYCTSMGYVDEAYVYHEGGHLESVDRTSGDGHGWGTENGYLIHLAGNAHFHATGVRFQMGSDGATGDLNRIINPATGPANYGNGRAKFENCTAFSYTSTGGQGITSQPHTMHVPEGVAEVTVASPFLSKWSPVTVSVAANDWRSLDPAHPQVVAVVLDHSSGTVTATLSVAAPDDGVFVKVDF